MVSTIGKTVRMSELLKASMMVPDFKTEITEQLQELLNTEHTRRRCSWKLGHPPVSPGRQAGCEL